MKINTKLFAEMQDEKEVEYVKTMLNVVNLMQRREGKPDMSMKVFLRVLVVEGVTAIKNSMQRAKEKEAQAGMGGEING